jgi:hypothetical protein
MAHKDNKHIPAAFCQSGRQSGASASSAPHRAANTLSRGLTDSNRKRLCPEGHSPHATRAIRNPRFPGDKPANNGDNRRKSFLRFYFKMYRWKLRPCSHHAYPHC